MSTGTGPVYTPTAAAATGIAFTGYAVQDTVAVLTYREELNTAAHVPYTTQNEILALIQISYGRLGLLLVRNIGTSSIAAGPVSISGHYGVDSATGNPVFSITIAQAGQGVANAFLLSSLAASTSGYAYLAGTFTSSLNTLGASIGAPVYLASAGGLQIEIPDDDDLIVVQQVGVVQTLASAGVISGFLATPQFVAAAVEEDVAFV